MYFIKLTIVVVIGFIVGTFAWSNIIGCLRTRRYRGFFPTVIPVVLQSAILVLFVVLMNRYAYSVRYYGYAVLIIMFLIVNGRSEIE